MVTESRHVVYRLFSVSRLKFFWIWGLGLVLLAPIELANLLVGSGSKRLDALAWVVIGAGLPLASVWVDRRLRLTTLHYEVLGSGALLFMVLFLGAFVANSLDNVIALLFGSLECWLFFRVLKLGAFPQTKGIDGRLGFTLVVLFTWAAVVSLVWWSDPYVWLIGSPWAITVTVATSILVFSAFWTHSQTHMAHPLYHRFLLGATSVVILIGSFYPLDLSVMTIYHEWSFYVGAAQLVRDGGTLLWDVPSQYGFLSILLLADLPMRSLPSALYVLNGIANLVMALSFVGIGWLILRSFLARATVGLLVVCVMFLRSGLAPIYFGANYYPSTGGYRFLWMVLVMFIFVWATHRYGVKGFPRSLGYLTSAIWVVSVFWSAESMIYTSVVFVPGFLVISVVQEEGAIRRALGRIIAPLSLLAAALAVIVVGYQAQIGHPPDPYPYVQYLLAYNAGFAILPVTFLGPAWILFLLAVSVSAGVIAIRRGGFSGERTFWLLILCLGAFATASYYMASRSHPNNVINVSLFVCMPLLLLLVLTSERMQSHYLHDLLRLVVPVALIVLIASPLADATALQAYVHPPGFPPWRTVDQPHISAALQDLIDRAGITPDSKIILLSDASASTVMPPWRYVADGTIVEDSAPWLPVAPLAQIDLLPSNDREVFLERYSVSHHVGGWLIVTKRMDQPAWLARYIGAHYVAVESFQSPDWTATKYAPVGVLPSAAHSRAV